MYLPFQIYPGNDAHPAHPRRDRGSNPLSCAANSPGVKKLLIRALKTRNLYRVGIGLHTFADSWAHQNFSGALEEWNTLDRDSPIPSIGHAQALTTPDDFAAEWTDGRLLPPHDRICNRNRFYDAAVKIYKYLCAYNRRPFADAESVVGELFTRHVAPAKVRDLEERTLDFIISTDIQKYDRKEWLQEAVFIEHDPFGEELSAGYDRLLWLKDALLARAALLHRKHLRAPPRFYRSHLYQWYEAARAHLRTAREISDAAPEPAEP